MTTLKCPYCVKEFNSKSNLNQHLNKKYKCFTYDNNTQSCSTNTSYLSNEEIEILKNKLNKTTILNNNLKNENTQLKLKLNKIYDVIIEKHDKNVSSNILISSPKIDTKSVNDTITEVSSQDKTSATETLSTITPDKIFITDTLFTTIPSGHEYKYTPNVLPKKWIKSKTNKPPTI